MHVLADTVQMLFKGFAITEVCHREELRPI